MTALVTRVPGRLLLAAGALLAAGCASIPPDAGRNPADPWERYNRHMSEFNDRVDRALLKPVAQGYVDYVPRPVRDCLGNAFANLNDVPNALNNFLQGKAHAGASDLCRVVINSTIGLLGCFDIASTMGLERHDEDFGQTLGRWGAAPGPYFVWPFLGPSTVRDSVGRVAGFYTDPVDYIDQMRVRNSIWGTRLIDTRAALFPAERIIDGAALDKYQFIRDGFLQRRRNLVYDGNPPRPKDDDEDDADQPAVTPGQPPPADRPPPPQQPVAPSPAPAGSPDQPVPPPAR